MVFSEVLSVLHLGSLERSIAGPGSSLVLSIMITGHAIQGLVTDGSPWEAVEAGAR